MNWDEIKRQMEASIKTESLHVIDQAIERLQLLRTELLDASPKQPANPLSATVEPRLSQNHESLPAPMNVPNIKQKPHTAQLDQLATDRRSDPDHPHLQQKRCVQCGEWFTPRTKKQTICSKECKDQRMRDRAKASYQAKHAETKSEPIALSAEDQQWDNYGRRISSNDTAIKLSDGISADRLELMQRQSREQRQSFAQRADAIKLPS